MTKLLKWAFDTATGQLAFIAIGLLTLFLFWQQQSVGAQNAVTELNSKAHEQSRKARDVRDRVGGAGALARLRQSACGDC